MPNIIINETEQTTFSEFDATENTVLIPMLYARSVDNNSVYLEPDNLPGKLYKSATIFKSDMDGHIIYIGSASEEFYDRSYYMAYELLLQGLNVVIKPITYNNVELTRVLTEDKVYELLENALNNGALEEFVNRNTFNLKFITTGAYANCGKDYEVEYTYSGGDSESEGDSEVNTDTTITVTKKTSGYTTIRDIARRRGDAIALLEFDEYYSSQQEFFNAIQDEFTPSGEDDLYSAAFFPWGTYNISGLTDKLLMPASFGYLMAYAYSTRDNANWFAAAGTVRGFVPGLIKPNFDVGESMMHILQNDQEAGNQLSIMVNPIYNAGTYGYRIWGNRVVKKSADTQNDRYMNFLNVRMLLCDIKKQIYHSAMRLTFEPNDDIVWINFKTLASVLLEKMKSGRGIKWYRWKKEVTTKKATIVATLTIQPIEAVESFEITVLLTDEDTTISEVTDETSNGIA